MKAAAGYKNYDKIHVNATIMCFKNEITHTKFEQCVRTINLVSLFIKVDVCNNHMPSHLFFSIFTRLAQQTKNTFAAAFKLQYRNSPSRLTYF